MHTPIGRARDDAAMRTFVGNTRLSQDYFLSILCVFEDVLL